MSPVSTACGRVASLRKIEDEDADRLDGVPGRFQHLQPQAGKLQRGAIRHGDERILSLGAAAQVDCGAAAVAKLQMAGDKVGVEVGEKDMADGESVSSGVSEVLLDIALGIDNDGGRGRLVGQQVRGVRQAAKIVLLQEHG